MTMYEPWSMYFYKQRQIQCLKWNFYLHKHDFCMFHFMIDFLMFTELLLSFTCWHRNFDQNFYIIGMSQNISWPEISWKQHSEKFWEFYQPACNWLDIHTKECQIVLMSDKCQKGNPQSSVETYDKSINGSHFSRKSCFQIKIYIDNFWSYDKTQKSVKVELLSKIAKDH